MTSQTSKDSVTSATEQNFLEIGAATLRKFVESRVQFRKFASKFYIWK
jgi:hypothetical protein